MIVKGCILVDDFITRVINHLAIIINDGIHPKHELMKYYNFFVKNISTTDNVLDIGCGTGFVANAVSKKAANITGVDVDKNNVSIARKKFKKENLKFIIADATNYTFNQVYDVIILSNVLEHIQDRTTFLQGIKKIAPKMLIRVPMINRDWLVLYKKQLKMTYFSDKTHFIEYDEDSFANEISEAGLKIKKISIQFGEIWAIINTK